MSHASQPSQSQSQSQHAESHQSQSVQVLIQGSSDPALERRIFTEIASAGRQLARMSDVLDALIAAHLSGGAPLDARAAQAIDAFRAMRQKIEREKQARTPERIIEALDGLKQQDSEQFDAVLVRLRAWIDEQPAARAPAAGDPAPER